MRTKSQERPSLKIKRFIKAPRERVFAAWTDPDQLKEWFGPEHVRTRSLIADPQAGGKFQWELTSPDGEELTVIGEYQEVVPNQKIVFIWQWQDDDDWVTDSVVTVELTDAEGGTDLCLTHVRLPNENSRNGHTKGWNSSLDKLEKWLSK